uniref:Receptor protein-tyrosine kinase n=2 Tax=Scylla olivacea TaxID=85551 RepID=A0A0P4VYT9_SCYOL
MSSFFVLLLVCCVAAELAVRPPRLNVGQEVVIKTEKQKDFELRCEGDKALDWDISAPEDYAEIESEEDDDGEYPYVSTLTVISTAVEDTGFYRCHYDKYTSLEKDQNNVASTYIYVYDGKHDLVDNTTKFVRVNTNERLVLGCRTTLPATGLLLHKNGAPVDTSDTHRIRWDSKIGFTLLSLTIHDSGMYNCRSESTGEVQQYHVNVSPASSLLGDPIIDETSDPHYTVGHPFSLNCTVVEGRDKTTLSWSYPNTAARYNTSTVKVGTSIVSTLVVPSATLQDSGVYTCTASDLTHSTKDSLTIAIKDSLEPYVRINSTDLIIVNETKKADIRWKAEVYSFPSNPTITYQNWRGDILTDSERIKIYVEPGKVSHWFIIKNFTASDFGEYTITATTRDKSASSNKSVTFEIHSAPKVELHDVPQYVWPQTKLQVVCRVQGFPLPSIRWEFQPCVNGPLSCTRYENIEITEGSLKHREPGNVVESLPSLTAESLGYLRCVANNTLGSHSATTPVTISDIGGLHVLNHTGLSSQALTLIENDDFLLSCGANKLHYGNVTLRTPPGFFGQVKERDTNYSFVQEVKVQGVTKAVEGKYECVAVLYGGKEEIKEVNVGVIAEVKVHFKKDSNMAENKTMNVKTGEELFLNCTVFGTPAPKVTWMKNNNPLTNASDFFDNERTLLSKDGQRIEIKVLRKKEHEGVYTCRAENRMNAVVGKLQLSFAFDKGLTTPAKIGLAVACFGIAILIITVVILFKRVKTERKFRKSFRANELYLFEKGNIGQLNPDCSADEQAELLPYGQEWEVPRDRISLGKQLGSGAFGRVVKAKVTDLEGPGTTTAAIKMCKSQAEQSQVRALALELKIMIHLGKHLNIVNLMGANTMHIGKGELWILVEYCRFGNILVFMHRHRRNFINQIDPNTGHIDINKMTPDIGSITSPFSPAGSWRLDNSRGSISHNRVSATHGPFPQSPPHSGTPQAHNPMYNASGGGHFLWPSNANPTEAASSDVSGSCCEDLKSPATTISTASDERTQNLYFTSTSGSSVSHGPMSEAALLDSHGKTMAHEVGSVPGVNTPFTTSHLVSWAWQVAHGMDYLASRKVLHGDLAARNLLLADDNVVKISDFGLSRDMYKKDIYMKKSDDLMPIKWISVEAIRDRIFSVQSDVWAFGVTLWEIFSLGTTPYPGIEVDKDFLQLLEDGYRMACPKYANQEIYDLLLECWDTEPMDRPSFMEALHRLGSLMQPDVKEEYLNMNDQYMRMNEERFKEQPDYLNMLTPPDYENMTNKMPDDDTKPHYVNMEVASGGRRDTTSSQHHATIQSPEMVSYCNLNLPASPASPAPQTTPHYLPMDGARHSPSPEDDVFTPGPDQHTRFMFAKGEDKSSPNKEDKMPFLQNSEAKGKNFDAENSSLIVNGHDNT